MFLFGFELVVVNWILGLCRVVEFVDSFRLEDVLEYFRVISNSNKF